MAISKKAELDLQMGAQYILATNSIFVTINFVYETLLILMILTLTTITLVKVANIFLVGEHLVM